jgi:4-hydroxy-tetrahydrodipicolinate synthase
MLEGLSAFPLTPLNHDVFDEPSYTRLITRLVEADVDSIAALGSTGSYMYLDRAERDRVARAAIASAANIPVIVGIGALRTSQVQALADDAQRAGATAVLLAPVSYQALTDDDVFGLFEDVTAALSVPLIVYDNPGTTHVTFTDDLYAAIAALPHVASIKIPGVPADPTRAAQRIRDIRDRVPADLAIGISGDGAAAAGLAAGCNVWYSVIAGTLPHLAQTITRAALAGDAQTAHAESDRLQPLWNLFAQHGSFRVTAAIAEHLGLVPQNSLPRPVRGLNASDRTTVIEVVENLHLAN